MKCSCCKFTEETHPIDVKIWKSTPDGKTYCYPCWLSGRLETEDGFIGNITPPMLEWSQMHADVMTIRTFGRWTWDD